MRSASISNYYFNLIILILVINYRNFNSEFMYPNSPSYSLSKASKGLKFPINNGVGPGQYNTVIAKTLRFTIPKSPRVSKQNKVPGPGNYDVSMNITQQHSPRAFLAKQIKAELFQITQNPGPGEYDVPFEKFKKGIANHYTFGKCVKTTTIKLTPGPGEYDSNVPKRGNKIGMGKSPKRFYLTDSIQNIPGPGEYNYPSRSGTPKFSFGIIKCTSDRQTTPGRSDYRSRQALSNARTEYSSQMMHRVKKKDEDQTYTAINHKSQNNVCKLKTKVDNSQRVNDTKNAIRNGEPAIKPVEPFSPESSPDAALSETDKQYKQDSPFRNEKDENAEQHTFNMNIELTSLSDEKGVNNSPTN
jgi:Sperm-tail PG-rich repeat